MARTFIRVPRRQVVRKGLPQPMTTRSPLARLAAVALTGLASRADTVIEGRVELAKATSVPVVQFCRPSGTRFMLTYLTQR